MQTPSKVVEISPARGRDERSLKWIAMACVIVYLVSLGSIFGMAMMAVQASKEVHVSEDGALVSADTGKPVAVDPLMEYEFKFSYELGSLPISAVANVASLEFEYVDANNVIIPAAYQIHAVRKTAGGRATFLTAVGDTITVDGSNDVAFLESDGVSYMIIVDDGRQVAEDKAAEAGRHPRYADLELPEGSKARRAVLSWAELFGCEEGVGKCGKVFTKNGKTVMYSKHSYDNKHDAAHALGFQDTLDHDVDYKGRRLTASQEAAEHERTERLFRQAMERYTRGEAGGIPYGDYNPTWSVPRTEEKPKPTAEQILFKA